MRESAPPIPYLDALLGAIAAATTPAAFAWLQEGIARLTVGEDREGDPHPTLSQRERESKEVPSLGHPVTRDPHPTLSQREREDRERDRAEGLATRSAGALRRLGAEPLGAGPLRLATACGELDAGRWRRGDAGRACLLLAATAGAAPGWEALVEGLFRHGDEGERAAVVRALCLLPDPGALRSIALEAGRANSMVLYAALALDNPYPAACYDDHAFNQLVLKSLFNGLPAGRIVGLTRRANPELSRLCEDYVDERVAAHRGVPSAIWLAMEPHASPRGLAMILQHLEHAEPAHRYHAALALSRRHGAATIVRVLAQRLDGETDLEVRRVLAAAVTGTSNGAYPS